MIKRLLAVFTAFTILLSFGACAKKDIGGAGRDTSATADSAGTGSTAQPSGIENPSEASAVQPETEQPANEQGISQTEAMKYAMTDGQEDISNAEAYLTLNPDGSFELEVRAYDGMPKITGSYVFENNVYRLENIETTSQLFDMETIENISFIVSGENLTYQGDSLEQVVSGAEFVPY